MKKPEHHFHLLNKIFLFFQGLPILLCFLCESCKFFSTITFQNNTHWLQKLTLPYFTLLNFFYWGNLLYVLVMSRTGFRLTLYSCLNVKELLARSRCEIWGLSDCSWTRIQNHLVRERTLNHLAKLVQGSRPVAVT